MPVSSLPLQGQSPAVLLAAAQSLLQASDLDGAKVHAEMATALAEAVGDRIMHARALTELTIILYNRNEMVEGMACALRAIELCDVVGDLTTSAKAHAVAARILLCVGETDAALEEGLAATRAADASSNLEAAMPAMQTMTNVYAEVRQWDKALEFGERYCEIARLIGDKASESAAIDTVSHVYGEMRAEATQKGDLILARAYAERTVTLSHAALLMARQAGSRFRENTILANLAESLSEIGRHQEALDLLDSWPADASRDTVPMNAHHRETRGSVLAGLGRHREAAELLAECLSEAPDAAAEVTACRALATLLEEVGDLRGALEHHKRLFALLSEQSSEKARRAASVAAVRLETVQAQTRAATLQIQAADLQRSNEQLNQRSEDFQRQAFEDP